MVDQNGNAVTNRWGDCSITDRFSSCETDTSLQSSCVTIGGPTPNKPCIFPFSHNGKTYQGCTPWTYGGANQGTPWCSTKTNGQGAHVNGFGNYGFCGQDCPAATALGVFIKSRAGIVFEEDNTQAPN
eukprot:TRINITY_DN894_c0_g1_i12.p2 TRINITY_DN894_c0_g1~~TRINITY_DN894_c0_g1_i12.p2  ORF type:complete len:128 (-),score=32.93 TRINITY_DN894_c0_g1_i12:76-459(-)